MSCKLKKKIYKNSVRLCILHIFLSKIKISFYISKPFEWHWKIYRDKYAKLYIKNAKEEEEIEAEMNSMSSWSRKSSEKVQLTFPFMEL
jgi:hypothetical protein